MAVPCGEQVSATRMLADNRRHRFRDKNRIQEGKGVFDDKSKRPALRTDSRQRWGCVHGKVAEFVWMHKGGIENHQQAKEMSRHGKPADDSAKLSVVIPKPMKARIKNVSNISGLQSFSDTTRMCLEYGLQRMERAANGKRH